MDVVPVLYNIIVLSFLQFLKRRDPGPVLERTDYKIALYVQNLTLGSKVFSTYSYIAYTLYIPYTVLLPH